MILFYMEFKKIFIITGIIIIAILIFLGIFLAINHYIHNAKTLNKIYKTIHHLNNNPQHSTSLTITQNITKDIVPICRGNDLSVSITHEGAAAGTFYYLIKLTDRLSKSCTISGYPTVYLMSNLNIIGKSAIRNSVKPVKTFTLNSGKFVNFDLGVPDSGNFPIGTCTSSSQQIEVFAPNDSTPLTSAFSEPYCPGFSVSAAY